MINRIWFSHSFAVCSDALRQLRDMECRNNRKKMKACEKKLEAKLWDIVYGFRDLANHFRSFTNADLMEHKKRHFGAAVQFGRTPKRNIVNIGPS